MSHRTQVTTKLEKKNYILRALDEMGFKYKVADEENGLVTKGRYSVHEKVDILITEANDRSTTDAIGFQKQKDGTYTAIGDFYGLRVSETSLRNLTTTNALKIETNDELMKLGFTMDNVKENNEEVELTFTRWV